MPATMNEWLPFVALAGLIIGLFVLLRSDIRELGARLDKHIDDQGKELRQNIKEVMEELKEHGNQISALKATIDTYFRLRVDKPQPPETPDTDPINKAA